MTYQLQQKKTILISNMKTFYDCVIHPRETDEWSDESCPTGKNDCDHCEHRKYIGTLGGEFYVQCDYVDTEEDD